MLLESTGLQHPVLSWTTQPPCWALLHRTATVSLGGKDWRPGAMKDESLQLFSWVRWEQVQTDLSCPAPAPMKALSVSIAHPERHSLLPSGAALQCHRQNTMLGCMKCSAGLPPDQSRLLPCQPRAWPEDLCCLHPPAQTGLRLAIIYLGLCFNPIWLSRSFQRFFWFLVGRGRRGMATRSPEEWGVCEQKLFALLPLKMSPHPQWLR